MNSEARPRVLWRLRVLMAEREIHSVRELRRRLESFGVTLSEPQLGRIVKGLPRLINTEHLSALCGVLNASPGDLLQVPGRTHASTLPEPTRSTAQAAVGPAKSPLSAVPPTPSFDPKIGPALSAFHKPNVR